MECRDDDSKHGRGRNETDSESCQKEDKGGKGKVERVKDTSETGDGEENDESEEDSSSEEDDSDSESETDTEIERPKVTLTMSRARRATAGKRMAALIVDEEADETFYKDAFGEDVFHDSGSDNYDTASERSWDELDSDFDDDEGEESEGGAQVEEPDEELKKKRSVYTDPLKAPKRRKQTSHHGPKTRPTGPRPSRAIKTPDGPVRVSKRSTAVAKANERSRRESLRAEKTAQKKVSQPKAAVVEPKLTQLDRLREAVKTERENSSSLKSFMEIEDRKKRKRAASSGQQGPFIRFSSVTELDALGLRACRNLISFTDAETSVDFFGFSGGANAKSKHLPIEGEENSSGSAVTNKGRPKSNSKKPRAQSTKDQDGIKQPKKNKSRTSIESEEAVKPLNNKTMDVLPLSEPEKKEIVAKSTALTGEDIAAGLVAALTPSAGSFATPPLTGKESLQNSI